ELGPKVLLPVETAEEIHALVRRSVDIARPEQRQISSREYGTVSHAAKTHVQIMRCDQPKPRPAFDMKRGRRRLMQLGLGVAELAEALRRFTRLEEVLPVVNLFAGADALQLQPRPRRTEQAAGAGCMAQSPHAIVAATMLALGRVVSNYGSKI